MNALCSRLAPDEGGLKGGRALRAPGAFGLRLDASDPLVPVMSLTRTSMDPAVNPIPTPKPFSFTLGTHRAGVAEPCDGPYHGAP